MCMDRCVLKHGPLKIQNYAGKFPSPDPSGFQMSTDPAMVYTRCYLLAFSVFNVSLISSKLKFTPIIFPFVSIR